MPFFVATERELFCFASKPRKKKKESDERESKSDVAKKVWQRLRRR